MKLPDLLSVAVKTDNKVEVTLQSQRFDQVTILNPRHQTVTVVLVTGSQELVQLRHAGRWRFRVACFAVRNDLGGPSSLSEAVKAAVHGGDEQFPLPGDHAADVCLKGMRPQLRTVRGAESHEFFALAGEELAAGLDPDLVARGRLCQL